MTDLVERLPQVLRLSASMLCDKEVCGPNNSHSDVLRKAADTIEAQAGEIESLTVERDLNVRQCDANRQEIERMKADADSFHMQYRIKCDEETKALHAEIERLRKDVERYRTWRADFIQDSVTDLYVALDAAETEDQIDSAIDAAMEKL
jgi:hypothetical protein